MQLVTASLDNQTILEGVTRRSVIELVRHHGDHPESWKVAGGGLEPLHVIERDFCINEIRDALAEGRLVEAFASGTAYFIAPIRLIRHQGRDLDIPCGEKSEETGQYAALIKGWLENIVFGRADFQDWTRIVDEPKTV